MPVNTGNQQYVPTPKLKKRYHKNEECGKCLYTKKSKE